MVKIVKDLSYNSHLTNALPQGSYITNKKPVSSRLPHFLLYDRITERWSGTLNSFNFLGNSLSIFKSQKISVIPRELKRQAVSGNPLAWKMLIEI